MNKNRGPGIGATTTIYMFIASIVGAPDLFRSLIGVFIGAKKAARKDCLIDITRRKDSAGSFIGLGSVHDTFGPLFFKVALGRH